MVLLLQRRADWVGGSNSGHIVLLLLGWHEQKEGGTTYDAGHAGQGSREPRPTRGGGDVEGRGQRHPLPPFRLVSLCFVQ